MKLTRLSAHVVVASLILTAVLWAQRGGTPGNPMASPQGLSGNWELSYDSRKVPKASLLPTVTAAKVTHRAKLDAHAIRWCNLMGLPFVMDSGRPIDVREGETMVMMVAENVPNARYLYKNRSTHINPDIYDPSTLGDSIAHWEGDTLVVDTIGFHPTHGVTAIPGGGYRTDKSHLVERYRVMDNGNILSVSFTWTDPTVFKTPHSYEFRYYRLPSSYEPRASLPCDPYNQTRADYLGDPLSSTPTKTAR
jgi:hypothetical protein